MPRGLTFYADAPVRRARQIVGDLLVLIWVGAWVLIGQEIHRRATTQGQGAQQLETAGGDFAQSMGDAGSRLGKVPFIGEDIQKPFDKASSAGTQVARAGTDIQVGTDQLGHLLGVLTAALPIALMLTIWWQVRWRYAQRVRAARALDEVDAPQLSAVRTALGLDRASLGLRPVEVARSGSTDEAVDVVSTGSTDEGSTDEGSTDDEVTPPEPPTKE